MLWQQLLLLQLLHLWCLWGFAVLLKEKVHVVIVTVTVQLRMKCIKQQK